MTPNTEPWLDEVYAELEDGIAPEWAAEAAETWKDSAEVADDVGTDTIAIYHDRAERYVPATDAEFEWAMRKRARALRKAEELAQHMAYEVELLTKAFRKRIDEQRDTADFFTDMIERGIEAIEPDSKGRRSVKTVVGTCYTQTKEHIDWGDEDALTEWATANNCVRVKKSPDKVAIKNHIHTTGEVPPGVSVGDRTTVVIREV